MAVFTAAMNAFLSNVPACCASIVSTFAALAWPATSSVGASGGVLRLLRLRGGRRVRLLGARESLDVALHLRERRVLARASPPAARTGGCSSLSVDSGRGRHGRRSGAATADRRCRAAYRPRHLAPARPASAPSRPALPSGETGLTGFGRWHRLLGRDRTRAEPGRDDRERRRGRLVGLALEVDLDAGRLRGLQALLDDPDVRLAPADLAQGARRCRTPRHRTTCSFPASSALTAELPAARCSANRPRRSTRPDLRPARARVLRRGARRSAPRRAPGRSSQLVGADLSGLLLFLLGFPLHRAERAVVGRLHLFLLLALPLDRRE